MDLSAKGRGKLAHIGCNQIYPAKRQKMFRKFFEHFLSCKNVQMGTNIFLNIFLTRGMILQIPKRSLGGTKCTYAVLASQMKNKNESGKHLLFTTYTF
jgi:hypothetical protein